MKRSLGLRSQLLLGVGILFATAAVTLGLLTWWALLDQRTTREIRRSQQIAASIADLVELWLVAGKTGQGPRGQLDAQLPRLTQRGLALRIQVFDSRQRLVADTSAARPAPKGSDRLVRRARLLQEQLVEVTAGGQLVVIVTPLREGRGLVRQWMIWPAALRGLPALFWVLALGDGLLLMLFVSVVLTSTVIHPVGEIERAAARVADGDYDVELAGRGPREVRSLANSFNRMAAAIKAQLEQLAAQQTSLIRSEKLASVGQLAAGVAHEVGNPLQAIVGLSDLLASRLSEARNVDLARRIENEAQRIHVIVRQLLDYARPVDHGTRAVSWLAVAKKASGLLEHQKRFKGIEVRLEGLAQLPSVLAVEARLVQVLLNLLLNAADAIRGASEADVDDPALGWIVVAGQSECGEVKVTVANSGPDVPAELRERVFDPFFSTKQPGQGTGLGLAVSRSIVEGFGGRLIYEGSGEQTCRFAIVLPAGGEST